MQKNINISLYTFLTIYCNFIKGVKVFIIIVLFLIREHQKIMSSPKTHFLLYYFFLYID